MHLKDELEQRGFIKQYTDEKLFEMYEKWWNNFYFGVDPSADSMTIGNFVALMQAIHVMLKGNTCYLLVGWATGMIGNPTGKDAERNFLDTEALEINQAGIANDMEKLCTNIEMITGKKLQYKMVNNYDWFKNMNYLDFLREVGKNMTVNWMMNKDIVKKRITDPDKFISYAEFSYMLIMWYDYYILNRDHNVTLEVWWSDEWDGILAGIEITHKLTGNTVYGLTNNLILDSNGKKFGKSEWNAIWLNPIKSSPFFVYQYFMNVSDEDVSRFLKLFTLLPLEDIDNIVQKHGEDLSIRYGQDQLARYVTETIHGKVAMETAVKVTEFLFGEGDKMDTLKGLSSDEIEAIWHEVGSLKITAELSVIDSLVESGLEASRGDAKKSITAGAIYLNEEKIEDIGAIVDGNLAINWCMILRKGKKNFRVLVK